MPRTLTQADPFGHPDLAAMSARELADLPPYHPAEDRTVAAPAALPKRRTGFLARLLGPAPVHRAGCA
ncbi:hypothetical protein HKCCE2091_11535 [Rhodobacterales bacterium HKCCE2091]|nr:hypothetical protein [Rhodobacterales bacterium HKCCE2091]